MNIPECATGTIFELEIESTIEEVVQPEANFNLVSNPQATITCSEKITIFIVDEVGDFIVDESGNFLVEIV